MLLFISRTWSSHVPFSSHLTLSDKLMVNLSTRRANTSADNIDHVSEHVS